MIKFIEDVRKFWKYSIYSAKAELKSEIANSHLSWLWWFLDPLLFMLVYAFIAVIVFQKSEKYVMAFVFIGLSTWDFFSKTVRQSVKIVSNNSQIISKVYMPKYLLIIIRMMTNGFKMIISFSLVAGIMLLYQVPLSWRVVCIIPVFVVFYIITFGISTILLHFGVYVEDLSNVVTVLLRLVFYLSGIFYSVSKRVPKPYNHILLNLNPVALVIDSLRDSLLYAKTLNWGMLLVWLVAGCLLSFIGVKLIYKYENSYAKVI